MRSPFDDLPIRRRSARLPVILTVTVVLAFAVVQIFGAGPFFSFESRRECVASVTQDGHVLAADPIEAVVGTSQSAFPCAERVTVAQIGDPAAVRTGARHAVSDGGPLLLVTSELDPAVRDELIRLEPDRVTMVGRSESLRSQVESLGVDVEQIDVDTQALSPPGGDERGGPVFLLDSAVAVALPAVEAIAAETGGKVLVARDVELTDLPDAMRLVIEQASALRLVGGFDPTTAWQVELVRSDAELPGGGDVLFPGRRLVGFYGSPLTDDLGALGEQGPEATDERMRTIIDDYGSDGVMVTPVFELIATVASASAGSDGDYSDETAVATLQPWVEYAAENGIYVVLDLQPGRTDFLTQARRYEALLRLPHVGLALDPEWRLGPDQRHLEQIGTVGASEVNAVAEWLAGIVRDEVLPQKVFMVHQFRASMISNREDLAAPEELAVVIQMDGQGTLPEKLDSWDSLTEGWNADTGYLWGWKNFFDEDQPMARPDEVLELRPGPVFVSFQ